MFNNTKESRTRSRKKMGDGGDLYRLTGVQSICSRCGSWGDLTDAVRETTSHGLPCNLRTSLVRGDSASLRAGLEQYQQRNHAYARLLANPNSQGQSQAPGEARSAR
jgi:hypothetical protein